MQINFESVKIKNFLSFGNKETLFEYKTGIHAVTGYKVPNTTSRNGIGKTTLLVESISFCIYGKTIKKILKEQIVNEKNTSECEVEVVLNIDEKDKLTISRGIKPDYLKVIHDNGKEVKEVECDSTANTQKWIDEKLKISQQTFVNLVLISVNGSTPFLQMDPKLKRPVVEDICSLNIYAKMGEIAKKNHLAAKGDIPVSESNYKNAYEKLENLKKEKIELERSKLEFEDEKNKAIAIIDTELTESASKLSKIKKQIEGIEFNSKIITTEKSIKLKLEEKSASEIVLSTSSNSYADAISALKVIEHTPYCPTCHTSTDNPLIQEFITELRSKRDENLAQKTEMKDKLGKISVELLNLNEEVVKLREKNNKLSQAKQVITSIEESIIDKEKSKQREEDRNFNVELISNDNLVKLETTVKVFEAKLDEETKKFKYNKFIRDVLSEDGVRKYVVLKILPALNKTVNHYLHILGSEYSISFDEELKETLFSKNSRERSYASFSGGEKKRMDLAVLLSLIDIAKTQNSVDTNLLVLDEVLDTSMDGEGIESFLEHINVGFKAAYPDKCIYIISHKKELPDEVFDTVITLVKQDEYTNIL